MVSLSSQQNSHAAEALAPARVGPSPAARRRRAHFVRAMKLVLPTIAVALIVLVLAWPGSFDRIAPLKLPASKPDSVETDTITMSKPRYIGTDGKGRPFMITADVASQDVADRNSVTLTRPQADMTMMDGSWFTLLSETGRYQQKQKTLDLGGKVSVFSDQGYEFHAADVAVDLNAGRAVTEKPVQGHGPFGELSAERMEITQNGGRYYFDDGVRVRLYPGRED